MYDSIEQNVSTMKKNSVAAIEAACKKYLLEIPIEHIIDGIVAKGEEFPWMV